MDNKNKERFNEFQPNSEQREEFLIVLEYLQNEAYDKKHATTQADIVKYALEKYKKTVRRDRIGQILIHLEQLSNSGVYSLPFKLEVIELNKIRKYYVSQRQFSNNEIVKLLTAIEKDKLLSDEETERLTAKILSVSTSKEKGQELYKKIKKSSKGCKKISQIESETYIDFVNACLSRDRIVFKIKDVSQITISDQDPTLDVEEKYKNKEIVGIAYSRYELGNDTIAVIYLEDIKKALATKIDNIELLRAHSTKLTDEDFVLNSSSSRDIDDWVEKYYSGKSGSKIHFKLKITTNSSGLNLDEFAKSYKEFWKEDLKYIIVDREVKINSSFGDEVLIAKDAIFELDANLSAFRKWYSKNGNFDQVVILEPARYNDLFLESRIQKYANRLTKYGTKYNYTINKEYKVEYKKEVDRRNHKLEVKRQEFFVRRRGGIVIYMGDDVDGASYKVDLKKVKNIVGVGTTGAGKSVYLHSICHRLMKGFESDKVKFCFVDPKRIEFHEYKSSEYLYAPVARKKDEISELVDKLIRLSNQRIEKKEIPFPVIVFVDEYADVIDMDKSIEGKIANIMKDTDQNGIHFILMSQRNFYSKEIMASAPTRINFMIFEKQDALDPIDPVMALNLVGQGDSLVYNKELFGDDPKSLKAVWRRS